MLAMPDNITTLFYTLFVIASASVLGSIFVIITIRRYGSRSISSRLVLYLHLTLLFEDIASFPYIYNSNSILCSIMGFVRLYSGLSNIVIVGLMVQVYRNIFLEDQHHVSEFIDKYAEYISFIFPLITVLPFSMNMFQGINNTWCAEPLYTWEQITWYICVCLVWTYIIIIYSAYTLSYTMYTVYQSDHEMGNKLFKTIGMYAIVTMIVWNFLVGSTFEVISHYVANLIIYLCGIFYFFIFLTEKKSLRLFESFMRQNNFNLDDQSETASTVNGVNRQHANYRDHFSWEIDDEEVTIANQSRANSRNESTSSMTSSLASFMNRGSHLRNSSRISKHSMSSINHTSFGTAHSTTTSGMRPSSMTLLHPGGSGSGINSSVRGSEMVISPSTRNSISARNSIQSTSGVMNSIVVNNGGGGGSGVHTGVVVSGSVPTTTTTTSNNLTLRTVISSNTLNKSASENSGDNNETVNNPVHADATLNDSSISNTTSEIDVV